MPADFHNRSYQVHQSSYSNYDIQKELSLYKNWFSNNTTDIWQHLRMLDFLNHFSRNYPNSSWLTIGDGRFGTSAIYLNQTGCKALPTDIDVTLLKIAKEHNIISDYAFANAEMLPFEDNQFDFSFCKEAYHHFPRAYIAIYEMLRVSKKAIILAEPQDWLPSPIPRRILQLIKNSCKKIGGLTIPHSDTGNYEPIGNYVFSISKREIQKIALGLHLPCIAYKRFHDVYIEGVENEKISSNAPLLKRIKRKIFFQKILHTLGLSQFNHIIAIIFKEVPSENLILQLKKDAFNIEFLPKNPFLKLQ